MCRRSCFSSWAGATWCSSAQDSTVCAAGASGGTAQRTCLGAQRARAPTRFSDPATGAPLPSGCRRGPSGRPAEPTFRSHDGRPARSPSTLPTTARPRHLVGGVQLTFRLNRGRRGCVRRSGSGDPRGAGERKPAARWRGVAADHEILASIDGQPLTALDYLLTIEGLTVAGRTPARPRLPWEAEVEIDPAGNTALEGLYMSGGMYCTHVRGRGVPQDHLLPRRPDLMARFTVRIEKRDAGAPVDGQPAGQRARLGGMARPWPKPRLSLRARRGRSGGASATASPPCRAGGRPQHSGSAPATRADAPMRWYSAENARCAGTRRFYGARIRSRRVQHLSPWYDFNMRRDGEQGLNISTQNTSSPSPRPPPTATATSSKASSRMEYFHTGPAPHTCRDWFSSAQGGAGRSTGPSSSAPTCARGGEADRGICCNCARASSARMRGRWLINVRPDSYVDDQQLLHLPPSTRMGRR